MKRHLTYFIPILVLFFLTGCPGSIDSIVRKELGHGYIYHEIVNLPTISNVNSNKGIPGVVVSYDYNDNFIIALQKDCKLPEQVEYNLKLQGKYYDLLIEKGNSNYWIIVHLNDSIYGPYKLEEYLQKREELQIPKALKLAEE